MPKLVRLYIQQVAIGFLISLVFVGALLWFNVANLWHLVTNSDVGLLAVALLWLFNGIVFSGVQFGIAIMRMTDNDTTNGRGKRVSFDTPRLPQDASLVAPVKTEHG